MYDNVDELLKLKKFPGVLLMFGQEDFLLDEAYSRIMSLLCKSEEDQFNVDTLDGENCTIDQVVDICSMYPFMSDHRIVTVNHFDKLFSGRTSKKTETASAFARYLESPQSTTVLILKSEMESLAGISSDIKNSTKRSKAEKKIESCKFPFNVLLTKHSWIEFPRVWDSGLSKWIISRVKSEGKEITPDAAELIIAHTGNSLRELNNEINKLFIYLDEKPKITIKDVNNIVGASRQFNVFELQKAVGERSLPESLRIMEKILSVDRQEVLIITILTRFFTVLYKLSEENLQSANQFQLAGKVGVSPYFIPEYLSALKRYKSGELDNAFHALLEADTMVKSVSSGLMFIMEKMLIRIIDGKLI